MSNGHPLQTVDPRYTSWLTLVGTLVKLNVVKIGQTTHRFSAVAAMTTTHKPKPHWIPLAVTSLNLEYVEVVVLPRK